MEGHTPAPAFAGDPVAVLSWSRLTWFEGSAEVGGKGTGGGEAGCQLGHRVRLKAPRMKAGFEPEET